MESERCRMSVIVRMEMPETCDKCPMCGTASEGNGMYELWCMCGDIPASSRKRPDDCPILCELPDTHGRLVDADDAFAQIVKRSIKGYISNTGVYAALQEAPTIVPAERSQE